MCKVRLKSGGYGCRVGKNNKLCYKDDVIELEQVEADRLVSIGAAAYVYTADVTPPVVHASGEGSVQTSAISNSEASVNAVDSTEGGVVFDPAACADPDDSDSDGISCGDEVPKFSADMNANELRAAAKELGIKFPFGASKADMARILNDAFEEMDPSEYDVLDLAAEDPV